MKVMTGRSAARLAISSFVLATLMTASGCHTGAKLPGQARAIWVTRFDYNKPNDIVRIMDNCRNAGFNMVLFQVRGNGTVSYKSKIEPWAEQYNFRDPGFDPLALAIDEAHSRGMQLHAWVNVMPAWRGPGTPAIKEQLYHAHPDWFWYDKRGVRQPIRHQVGKKTRDWYVSLNPCLPEVRHYLVDLFRELVTNYDVDGLHMDYIRFPNEPVVKGERIPDYPRDKRTLALFRKDTGHTPDSNKKSWTQWRTEQVTRLVSDVRQMMKQAKPSAALSAAVGSVPQRALKHYQDGQRWLELGLLDAVCLMNYTPDAEEFTSRIKPWLELDSGVPILPGLSISDKPSVAEGANTAAKEIAIARSMTGNYCVFAYSRLFDSSDNEFAKQGSKASRKRATRRGHVLPEIGRQMANQ